ncbi:MAG: hypothetical protein PHG47_07840 [Sulfuricella sp.]|nr:hypothetical protein [Sulfuricella sp.]
MKSSLIDPDTNLAHECYALVYAPSANRKRFPENCVTLKATEEEARAAADTAKKLIPAVVFGPSRSSEGFRLFYLVRWLDN